MTETVLILGANGRFGRNAAQAFAAAGWRVRRFDRARDNLDDAARGVQVIVNAWNPPYTEWEKTLPGLHAAVQKAALASGATVIVPGNVYVFGPDTPAPWSETAPHRAGNPLGRARIAMEESYRRSGVQTILLRAGDFLDTEASGNWFDMIMAARVGKGVFRYPGQTDIPHAWAYLPDLCRATVALAGMRQALPQYADIPFPGYTLTGAELHAALPVRARLAQMSWLPIRLASVVWPMGRRILEMRYLWNTPHWLDGKAFEALLPDFEQTPVEHAVRAACRPLLPDLSMNAPRPVANGAA